MADRTWIEDVLRGPQGAAGAAGATGPTGPTGPAGPPGPSGGIVDVVIDFADLDTQDLSSEPDGTVVTLSDGSEWTTLGAPSAGHTFGIINGVGLVYERLGAGSFEGRALYRTLAGVDSALALGDVYQEALYSTDVAMAADTVMSCAVGYSADGVVWDGNLYYESRVIAGGVYPARVETSVYFGGASNCMTWCANVPAAPTYDTKNTCVGVKLSASGMQAAHTAYHYDVTANPLTWPTDEEAAFIGHSSLALASAQGASYVTGNALTAWLSNNASKIIRRQALALLYIGSNNARTVVCRAARWRNS